MTFFYYFKLKTSKLLEYINIIIIIVLLPTYRLILLDFMIIVNFKYDDIVDGDDDGDDNIVGINILFTQLQALIQRHQ
jgi:hypothetical protein